MWLCSPYLLCKSKITSRQMKRRNTRLFQAGSSQVQGRKDTRNIGVTEKWIQSLAVKDDVNTPNTLG